MSHDEDRLPLAIPLEALRILATTVAADLKAAPSPLPGELREQFIAVRAALFQRGIYDPVLVRFDSATAPPASHQEVGEQLAAVAQSL